MHSITAPEKALYAPQRHAFDVSSGVPFAEVAVTHAGVLHVDCGKPKKRLWFQTLFSFVPSLSWKNVVLHQEIEKKHKKKNDNRRKGAGLAPAAPSGYTIVLMIRGGSRTPATPATEPTGASLNASSTACGTRYRSTASKSTSTPKENARPNAFSQLFLCLSRACLGKMVVFSIKMAPKKMFSAPKPGPVGTS